MRNIVVTILIGILMITDLEKKRAEKEYRQEIAESEEMLHQLARDDPEDRLPGVLLMDTNIDGMRPLRYLPIRNGDFPCLPIAMLANIHDLSSYGAESWYIVPDRKEYWMDCYSMAIGAVNAPIIRDMYMDNPEDTSKTIICKNDLIRAIIDGILDPADAITINPDA